MTKHVPYGFETLAIHAGQQPDPRTGAVVPPIYQTSTYAQDAVGSPRLGYEYSRTANPTRDALQECLAALEGGRHAFAFSSGMAAEDTLLRTVCQPGDRLIIPDDAYGGTFRLISKVAERWGVRWTAANLSNLDSARHALTGGARVVWVETPTNPLLGVADIAGLAQLAHDRDALLVVDNTFASPYLQQPLSLGADVVMHSTTKYLNGHSDGIGGALIGSKPEHKDRFCLVQKAAGGVLSPFECFLVLRGIKTMPLRIQQHEENGRSVAEFLSQHPKVTKLAYPGLKSHPQYDLAVKQQKGFGSMMSFDIGSRENAAKFLGAIQIFLNAESLGGVESLASHSATTTHGSVSAEERV